MPTYTTIKITTDSRDELEKIKFRIMGVLQQAVTQGDALEILAALGQNHLDEIDKLAQKWREDNS
jgi:hypothetical protein